MIYREAGQFRTSYAADQAVFPILQDRLFVWGIALFGFFVVPFLASEYLLRAILVPFLILAIAAIGLNLLVGYCGQISLGSAAFMAVGAYASYDVTVHLPWLNLLLAFSLAFLFLLALANDFGFSRRLTFSKDRRCHRLFLHNTHRGNHIVRRIENLDLLVDRNI